MQMMTEIAAYLVVVAAMSLVCFMAYGFDKDQAVYGGRRVPESTLHMLEFLGGWPGALLGQRFFRHKTQKRSFLMEFWLVVFLHFSAVGAVAYTAVDPSYRAFHYALELIGAKGLSSSQASEETSIRITPARSLGDR